MSAHYSASGAALFALLAELEQGSPLAGALPLAPGRRALLRSLHRKGPATVSELARRRGAARQSVQRLADAMSEEGLLERAPNPRHRRAPLFAVTRAGEQAIAACADAEAALANDWAQELELEPEALREATRLLRRIREAAASPEQP